MLAVKKAAHLAASCWKNFAVPKIEGGGFKRLELNAPFGLTPDMARRCFRTCLSIGLLLCFLNV